MRPVAAYPQLPPGAPDFLADELGRSLPHDSGIVPARGARTYRVGHGAQHSLYVAGIDAGADDLNDRRERARVERHINTEEMESPDVAVFALGADGPSNDVGIHVHSHGH